MRHGDGGKKQTAEEGLLWRAILAGTGGEETGEVDNGVVKSEEGNISSRNSREVIFPLDQRDEKRKKRRSGGSSLHRKSLVQSRESDGTGKTDYVIYHSERE